MYNRAVKVPSRVVEKGTDFGILYTEVRPRIAEAINKINPQDLENAPLRELLITFKNYLDTGGIEFATKQGGDAGGGRDEEYGRQCGYGGGGCGGNASMVEAMRVWEAIRGSGDDGGCGGGDGYEKRSDIDITDPDIMS